MRFALPLFLAAVLVPAASAKLGETPTQITKRFGSNYTVEHVQSGDVYKYRLKTFSVDVTFTDGLSTCETYYSDHPLDAKGEPPKEIVQGVLHTNVPKAKWREIVASYLQADYALRSEDYRYIATINYKTPQPAGVIWTITVQVAKPASSEQIATSPKAPVRAPEPAPQRTWTMLDFENAPRWGKLIVATGRGTAMDMNHQPQALQPGEPLYVIRIDPNTGALLVNRTLYNAIVAITPDAITLK